jgi:phosphopantetheine adenylyltransferase
MYSSSDVKPIKTMEDVMGEACSTYSVNTIFVSKHEEKRSLQRYMCRWEDGIKE